MYRRLQLKALHLHLKTLLCLTLAMSAMFVLAVVDNPVLAQVTATPSSSSTVLFQNVRIFDGKSGALSPISNVLVRGNRIEKISTAPIAVNRSANTTIINGA
ncbi:MAG: hypothetical protein JO185_22730, partial [Acidobacteriaceae bacterium]|nr:hypothetical protein [Acidobacteriaceae bacterium]